MKFSGLIFLFLAASVLDGCNNGKTPDPNPGDDKFANLHAYLLIFRERSVIQRQDSVTARRGKDSILAANHATPAEYEKALEWYKRDIESWKGFNEKVVKQLEELQRKSSHGNDSASQIPVKK